MSSVAPFKAGRDLDAGGRAVGYDSVHIDRWPSTDLAYEPDDPDRPRELTLFDIEARGDRLVSRWITAGVDDVIPEEEWR